MAIEAVRRAHLPCKIVPGGNAIRKVQRDGDMLIEINCDIPLKNGVDVLRCNVYRPLPEASGEAKLPAIMTAGPYGKDIPYSVFHANSYAELPEEQKSKWSAWEVPEPTFWTKLGYAVVRVDEQGSGQSPGFMDTMSDQTSSNFAEAIEWVSEQPWCSGRVGLLGISYYAGSQWRVAARRPKGLACVIPWEGMHDYYRDRVRPGGILSNGFINFWQNRQINTNQFGVPERSGDKRDANLPGMSPRPANEEGTLSEEQLRENRTDQTVDTLRNKFMDDPYFASREYRLSDIKVPMLSVANWGGICLHLRGNVLGYLGAASPLKWLYFITGRHDLPFYLPEWTALQKSFFDAFLKDEDDRNWKGGPNAANGVPAITYCNRKGNPGFNKTSAERTYGFKQASAWPLPNTSYETLHLSPKGLLEAQDQTVEEQVRWSGLTGESVRFSTQPFAEEREVTGHPVLHVTLSVAGDQEANIPSDLDLFVTLRHIDPQGQEVMYTGTAGDPVPLTKGWLRLSMRKLAGDSLPYLPKRNYLSSEVQPLKAGERYSATVELWPTNVTVEKGGKLVLEVGPKDQQGCGIFVHNHPEDRPKDVFAGVNVLHTGPGLSDLVLPFVK